MKTTTPHMTETIITVTAQCDRCNHTAVYEEKGRPLSPAGMETLAADAQARPEECGWTTLDDHVLCPTCSGEYDAWFNA